MQTFQPWAIVFSGLLGSLPGYWILHFAKMSPSSQTHSYPVLCPRPLDQATLNPVPWELPSSYQLMLANSYSSLSSLIRPSMSLVGFCYNLTLVINPVVMRRGKGRSWEVGLLPCSKDITVCVPTRGECYLLIGRNGPPPQLWGLNGIWRARIFEGVITGVLIWCVRVPGLPNQNPGVGIIELSFIFNRLSSLATLLNPEFSLQLVLLPHCRQ